MGTAPQRTNISAGTGVEDAPGTVYAFVPAQSGSDTNGLVQKLCRILSDGLGQSVLFADSCSGVLPAKGRENWGAFLTLGVPFDTLETKEADEQQIPGLMQHARTQYSVTCANLADSKETATLATLKLADWIFVVSGTDTASIEGARQKADWLRSIGLDENCGLLVHRVRGGAGIPDAEEITGLPVCALVDQAIELERLAAWLATPRG